MIQCSCSITMPAARMSKVQDIDFDDVSILFFSSGIFAGRCLLDAELEHSRSKLIFKILIIGVVN